MALCSTAWPPLRGLYQALSPDRHVSSCRWTPPDDMKGAIPAQPGVAGSHPSILANFDTSGGIPITRVTSGQHAFVP